MRDGKCDGIGDFRPFQCPDEDDICCEFFHLQLKFTFLYSIFLCNLLIHLSIMHFKALQNAFLMEEHV